MDEPQSVLQVPEEVGGGDEDLIDAVGQEIIGPKLRQGVDGIRGAQAAVGPAEL